MFRFALAQLADHLGEGGAPRSRHDAERRADPAAVEHRIRRAPRRGRVVGGGDRLDQRRGPSPWRREVEDRLGETVPRHPSAAGNTDWGTYHFPGGGRVTWHGLAEAIFDLAAPWRGTPPLVEAITTADYPTAARRPANSVLDLSLIHISEPTRLG